MNRIFYTLSNNKDVFFYVFSFGLVAHGFVFFNEFFSYDSLVFDHNYAIGLGRWGQSVVFLIRGQVFPPTLIGFISLLFLTFSCILFLDLFNINLKIIRIIICGTLVTSYTFTAIASTFMFYLDVNMLAMMFIMLSCYYLKNCNLYRNKLVFGSIFLMLALSLYQVYLQLYTLICALFIFFELLKNSSYKKIMTDALLYVLVLLIGLILYKLSIPLSLKFCSIHELSTSYNTITKVGIYDSLWQLFSLFVLAAPFELRHTLFSVTYFSEYLVFLLLLICLLITVFLIFKRTKYSIGKLIICEFVFLFAIPFFANIVYIISKGLMHDLMRYSYSFVMLVPLLVVSFINNDKTTILMANKKIAYYSRTIIICMSLLIFSNIVFSNQIYLKKELEAKSSLSIGTRIVSRIEELPNFKPNSTKVCFLGKPSKNQYFNVDRILISKNNLRMSYDYNVAFEYYPYLYFRNILGVEYRICDVSTDELIDKENMPIFPLKGSIVQEQDRVYVKLGNVTIDKYIDSSENDEIGIMDRCSVSFSSCIKVLKYRYSKLLKN